jgi:hypothetical protein
MNRVPTKARAIHGSVTSRTRNHDANPAPRPRPAPRSLHSRTLTGLETADLTPAATEGSHDLEFGGAVRGRFTVPALGRWPGLSPAGPVLGMLVPRAGLRKVDPWEARTEILEITQS